jgi:hypothetical protein
MVRSFDKEVHFGMAICDAHTQVRIFAQLWFSHTNCKTPEHIDRNNHGEAIVLPESLLRVAKKGSFSYSFKYFGIARSPKAFFYVATAKKRPHFFDSQKALQSCTNAFAVDECGGGLSTFSTIVGPRIWANQLAEIPCETSHVQCRFVIQTA